MDKEDEETEKAVEAVDKMEDEEAEKREEHELEDEDKIEEDVICCPKCKRPVTEGDFAEDQLSEPMSVSIMSRINCPQCGYAGFPIELSVKEYQKLLKEGKKPE